MALLDSVKKACCASVWKEIRCLQIFQMSTCDRSILKQNNRFVTISQDTVNSKVKQKQNWNALLTCKHFLKGLHMWKCQAFVILKSIKCLWWTQKGSHQAERLNSSPETINQSEAPDHTLITTAKRLNIHLIKIQLLIICNFVFTLLRCITVSNHQMCKTCAFLIVYISNKIKRKAVDIFSPHYR